MTSYIEFNVSDPAVDSVLVDGNPTATSSKRDDDADYLGQAGLELVQDDIATGSPQTFEVFGVVKKTYIVREQSNNAYVDKFTLEVPAKFYIEASLKYQAWVDQTLTKSEKNRLAQLLTEFVGGPMDKPEKFAADNNVDFNAFAAEPYFFFKRSTTPPVLLDDYEQEVINSFVQSERFKLQYLSQRIELGEINIQNEGIDADDPDALQNHLEKEFEEVGCANPDWKMEVTEYEIKKIIEFSEFKTIIAWKWVTIGCCKTKIPYPKVLARGAEKVVVVELMTPDNFVANLKTILKKCAEKAAVTGLAVAYVAWVSDESLEKALIAFKAVFFECVEEGWEDGLVPCIVPVILVKKRPTTDWKDAF